MDEISKPDSHFEKSHASALIIQEMIEKSGLPALRADGHVYTEDCVDEYKSQLQAIGIDKFRVASEKEVQKFHNSIVWFSIAIGLFYGISYFFLYSYGQTVLIVSMVLSGALTAAFQSSFTEFLVNKYKLSIIDAYIKSVLFFAILYLIIWLILKVLFSILGWGL